MKEQFSDKDIELMLKKAGSLDVEITDSHMKLTRKEVTTVASSTSVTPTQVKQERRGTEAEGII